MAKKNTEVTKKEESAIDVFTEMGASEVTGFEGADFESFATPFLRILQSNNPQVLEDTDNFIPDSKPGFFFNTVTNALYGRSVEVIPVRFERMFVEWRPNREGFVAMHGVEEGLSISDPGKVFGSRIHKETENILQDTHTFYLLIAGRETDGPIIFPLSSTGIRHSRKWMSMAKMLRLPNRKAAPLYSSIYKLTTVINENDSGRWYQIGDRSKTAIERIGWINAEQLEYVTSVMAMFDQIKTDMKKQASGFNEDAPF